MVTDDELREILDADTVAVVGCSTTPGKAAHDIPAYLQNHGYRVIPINPFADDILGETAYDSLADVPGDADIDIVDVFRPSEEAGDIAAAAVERHESVGDVRSVWLQLGITNDDAKQRVQESGLEYVQDRCMKVEHGRLVR
ncbi:CoA-binding protein [Halogeometricum borinquense DSM 11551]|uniref:CoA-binding protein n=2 Tax=Halogeometricum borinquense TaxID=60847 RepID=E4NMV9_HALBP|nr:CoA-binding protein [Halogeometricum borinquense]ADQ67371.1 predicted CoA-binding protein [Halogeometricum borinquense DSM 11551]ELY28584.1 CoA-binding protein [Halogeometricum borinquense DSM 11551]RYJ13625.1 CoA-binding protein [Halogeometricum borinquense]